ncbi:MAG: hypothetical protein K9L30_15435 [Desulfobacterales bacterium]|nr:hypothetical protein [Desulfobacterales bacterium]
MKKESLLGRLKDLFGFNRDGKKNWTLLMVGDEGHVMPINGVRWLARFTLYALIISIVLILCIASYCLKLYTENNELRQKISTLDQKTVKLRQENEILMTDLVLGGSSDKTNTEDFEPVDNEKTVAAEGLVQQHQRILSSSSIAIQDLNTTYDTQNSILSLQFKLKNLDSKVRPLKGNTFVILKNDSEDQSFWMALPPSNLVDGIPALPDTGRAFSINNFKTETFSVKNEGPSDQFTRATIMIFNHKGKLELEKDIEL